MPAFPAVFGHPPAALAEVPAGATQLSPLVPGSTALQELAPGALSSLAMLGCAVEDRPKAHHRICSGVRPEALDGIDAAVAAGAPRLDPGLGLWTQPGVFSWDRLDPGTALLMENLPRLSGEGADLGCGIGVLAHPVLASDAVTALTLVDTDRRAVEAARRNVADPRATHLWADARTVELARLDFVVMNPPFHAAGAEDKGLGTVFVRKAAACLRTGGHLWMVANKHLPYEAVLKAAFKCVTPLAEANGFKVLLAVK